MNKTRIIQFRVTEALADETAAYAEQKQLSVSDVIRLALIEFFKKRGIKS